MTKGSIKINTLFIAYFNLNLYYIKHVSNSNRTGIFILELRQRVSVAETGNQIVEIGT